MNKRLYKEIQNLIVQQNSKPLLENDYLIYFDDSNVNTIYTIIKPPYDSLYRHKFLRLDLNIPKEYPFQPPIVTFINYDGTRIHPTLYEDGRCCSTILNTWPSIEHDGVKKEAWSSSMGIETILLMFLSFLDYNPYTHEPGGKDDETYSIYVLHQTWKTCLLRYLYTPQPTLFHEYMNLYIKTNIYYILNDLTLLNLHYVSGYYYTPCFYIENYIINYQKIIDKIEMHYLTLNSDELNNTEVDGESETHVESLESEADVESLESENDVYVDTPQDVYVDTPHDVYVNTSQYSNHEIDETNNNPQVTIEKCQICFDNIETNNRSQDVMLILDCKHVFHTFCLKRHILFNGKLCSVCRMPTVIDEWLINPETNKRIKIDSVTYKKLIYSGKII